MKRFVLTLAFLSSLVLGTSSVAASGSNRAGNQTGPQPTATSTVLPTVTPTLRPGPSTAFFVLGVRFEHNWAGKAWNVNKTPQKSVKLGTKVQLSVYFDVSAVPAGSRSAIIFTLNRNGRVIYNKTYQEPVPRPENYKWYLKDVPLPTVGTYKLTIRVSINGITDGGSARLKVKKH